MSEHRIVRELREAKKGGKAMDEFILRYKPFVISEASAYVKRPVTDSDDELSIALTAFYEAINSYSREKGAFLSFASVVIKNRLIDFSRKEKRHRLYLSLDEVHEDEDNLYNKLSDSTDTAEEYALRDATKAEIEELTDNLYEFGVNLSDVADNCPRQAKTLAACRRALEYAMGEKEIFEVFLRTKRLPMGRISKGSGVDRKTLERHRKYLVAIFLIQTNGYEIIRGHIKAVLKGGGAQ